MINRFADHDSDGWMLRSGEEAHRAAPQTFWIPSQDARERLAPGDFVKLIFEIAVDDEDSVEVERMWVVVCGLRGRARHRHRPPMTRAGKSPLIIERTQRSTKPLGT